MRTYGRATHLGALLSAADDLHTPHLIVSRCRPGLNAAAAGDDPHAALESSCGPGCCGPARHELVDVRSFYSLPFWEKWRLIRWCLRYEPDTVPRVKVKLPWLIDAMRAAGFEAAPDGRFRVRRRRF